MRVFRYVVADVFTDEPLAGNPVAVFTDARGLETYEMQRLARELNLSESVFVFPAEQGGHARIRIFTPGIEMQFAGHPTLGTAFVLAAPMQLIEIHLETGAGIVPVALEREGAKIVFGRMAQPVPRWEPYAEAEALLAAVGVERSELKVEEYDNGAQHVYVALESEDAVAALRPNLGPLGLPEALGVNCFAGSGTRWKTRMFGLGGIPEDPATGSAAGPSRCTLRATAGSTSARRSRSRRESRSDGRRSSSPWCMAQRIRSSESRSAAARSPSPTASFGYRTRSAVISGSSGASARQKRPPSSER
jgi:trans-2,3-dihydro-3-hydroxyanthranilate isomerase